MFNKHQVLTTTVTQLDIYCCLRVNIFLLPTWAINKIKKIIKILGEELLADTDGHAGEECHGTLSQPRR